MQERLRGMKITVLVKPRAKQPGVEQQADGTLLVLVKEPAHQAFC